MGGFALEGVYSNACHLNNITPLKLTDAQQHSPDDPFGYVCKELNSYKLKKQYDYAILDEAQDFPKYFYRICRQITRMDRVIWAYDDFQNILNVDIQDEKETFGKNENDQYYIDFSRKEDELQDIVLHKCYRNPRKILLTAFALGLGIYNGDSQNTSKKKIIQRLENNDHWKDLGFEVESGNSEVGDRMIISRPEINSPLLKNQHLDGYGNIVRVKACKNINEECQHITDMILDDLDKELNPEDISVISLDNRFARSYFTIISRMLEGKGVKTFSLQDAPNNNKTYKRASHVTLSTIFKAKGNESGSIYVIGIDAIFRDKDNLTERNKLFTAITRSKAWVTLTGIAPFANIGISEIKDLMKNEFKLIFIQPSADEVNMIRQDLGQKQKKLNELERIKEDLGRLGMSDEEVKNHLFHKPSKK